MIFLGNIVIYGNGAFYGAVNIITNDFDSNGSQNIVSGAIGSEKSKKIFLRISENNEDFKYACNVSVFDTYGMNKPFRDMVTNPSDLENFGLSPNQTTAGNLENNEKYFNFCGSLKSYYFNIIHSAAIEEIHFGIPSLAEGTPTQNSYTNLTLGYKKPLSDIIKIDGKISYYRNRMFSHFKYLVENFHGIEQVETNAFEAGLDAFIKLAPKIELTTGLYYRAILNAYDLFDLPSFGDPFLMNSIANLAENDNIVTRAIFSQMSFHPTSKLDIIAGVRIEQSLPYTLKGNFGQETEANTNVEKTYYQDDNEFIPRLAMLYRANRNNLFKILYGKAINRPSFFQNYLVLLDPEHKDLKPESIQTFELNYITSVAAKLSIIFSLFRNELENLITRVVEFSENNEYSSWSDNAGEMVTNGFELTINSTPIKNLNLEISGIYQQTTDKRTEYTNIGVAYSPKLLGYIKTSYRYNPNLSVAITGNYIDAMETYWDELKTAENGEIIVNSTGPNGGRIGAKTNSYFTIGANLRFENLFNKGLFLNIRLSNLLDHEIRYPTYTNNEWANRGTLGMGRTYLVSMGSKF